MLDVPQADSDPQVIGDRALASHAEQIVALGREIIDGSFEGGALPVIKHMPGHGRALCDSHHALPRVVASKEDLRAVDFKPFRDLNKAPIGMTAHILYEAYDTERPATLSPIVIDEAIRKEIGFDGLLLTDDLKMKALGGPLAARSESAIKAGCDIAVCCNYTLAEKIDAAARTPNLAGRAAERAAAALSQRRTPNASNLAADYRRLSALLVPALA
ncbi:MAG: glycoside hydrolase family 3 N-terminal domain-containing protein, partial [Parvularculaceae bacterium]